MIHDAVTATVRFGVSATAGFAQLIVDNTVGRMLDTDPHSVR